MNNKTPKVKSPYMTRPLKWSKPLEVKEWTIKRIKEGHSPRKIVYDIKRVFKIDVALITIYRWRDKYVEVTGEPIAPWIKLNATPQQRQQHMYGRTLKNKIEGTLK